MSASLKRKRTDADMASGSAFSQISANNWIDPQYVNLQTLKNGLKRATFLVSISRLTFANIKKKSIGNTSFNDFIQFELSLPECTGLNALSTNDNAKTCYSPPTGRTKLNFPNVHDVTIRHNYNPTGWKSRISSGTGDAAKWDFFADSEPHMTILLTDGRENLQDMVPTTTDENNTTVKDGLFDLTRYSMGDGLIEGVSETHKFGRPASDIEVSVANVEKYELLMYQREGTRRVFPNNFSNITKGGYQVLNDNLKLLVYDSSIQFMMDAVGSTDNDFNTFSTSYMPWSLSVQIDYDVKQVELDKLLVYRQSLQQYISAKVKPEQKYVNFLDAVDTFGFSVLESRFETNERAKAVDQVKPKKKF